ncbi:hypothetical protein QUF73_24915 [Cytobacillus sp. NJ13]|nr:hypothetical protein [Cytobacillus sp. NJ13]
MREQLEELLKGKELTSSKTVDGVGTVEVYGKLDFEKLVERLLKSSLIK